MSMIPNTKPGTMLQKTAVVAGLACLCNLLWGSAIPFINLGYQHFAIQSGDVPTLILFAGCRFFLAGLLTILFVSIGRRKLVKPQGKGWRSAVKLAMVQTIGQYVFFYIGVANTVSMNASIIQGLGPFVSILIAALIFRTETMGWAKWAGGLVGIAGILFVHIQPGSGALHLTFQGEGFLLISMIASACSAVLIKRYGQQEDPVALSGWQFMLGGAVMALAGLTAGGRLSPDGPLAYGVLIYLAFLSAVAYTVWSLLLRENNVSRITVYIFLQPIFGVLLAWLFFGQQGTLPMWRYAAALLLVSCSILTVEKVSGRK